MEVIQVAQTVITRFTDDLDGSQASGSVAFGLDGREYMIDLSDENAARLRDALAPYVAAGRRIGRGRGRTVAAPSPASQRRNLAEARGWLRDHGYPVKDRGRIPEEWLRHFDTKTPQPPTVTTTDPRNDETPHDTGHSNGHAVEFHSA
jgi:Lsr2